MYGGVYVHKISAPSYMVWDYETVTLHLDFLPPSLEVAVIMHFPFDIAVTFPFEETVAMDEFELFQVTFLFDALEGVTVTLRA